MGYEAALEGYEKFRFDDGSWTRDVYRRGSGPGVIIIHEIPGLHPLVIRFADRVAAAGMTAYFALFVMINGAMVMGLAPVVGVPMPLLSYGGSSMMTVMFGFALVMATRVHRYAELPKGEGLF